MFYIKKILISHTNRRIMASLKTSDIKIAKLSKLRIQNISMYIYNIYSAFFINSLSSLSLVCLFHS